MNLPKSLRQTLSEDDRVNLLFVERVNRLTEKIILTRSELARRERRGPHSQHGNRRHQYDLETLRLKAEFMEKKRLALFEARPL